MQMKTSIEKTGTSGYLIRGFCRLKEPGIRWFVIIPLLINLLVFILLGWLAVHEFERWLDHMLALLPPWLFFLSWLLVPVFIGLLLFIMYFTFTVAANIIASPFNAYLAECIQKEYGFNAGETSWRQLLATVPESLAREGRKLLYYLPRIIALLIISFIPVLNIAAPVLWFVFSAWMMTVQYVDYPADNHKITFSAMIMALKQHKARAMGFGALVMLATLIPIVNLFVMPAAVIGATCMWEEMNMTK